jgi:hypothetical protein
MLMKLQAFNNNGRSTTSTIADTSGTNLCFLVGQDAQKSSNDTCTTAAKRMSHSDSATENVTNI